LKETAMSSTELPRHIVDRFERRWAKKLEQQARAWKNVRSESRSLTNQDVPVIRRMQRSRPLQKST
jgi:lantibiotic modifying enzyme